MAPWATGNGNGTINQMEATKSSGHGTMGNGQQTTAMARTTETATESKATINQTMEWSGGLAPWSMATTTATVHTSGSIFGWN
jgi:hypothetical protein